MLALAPEMPSSTVLRAVWDSKCCGCALLFAWGWIFPLQLKGATIAAINRFLIQILVSSCLTDTPQGASYAACSEKWKVLCIYSVNSEISDVISSAHFHNYLCGTTSCSHDGKGKGKKVGVENKRKREKKPSETPHWPLPAQTAELISRLGEAA